MGRYRITCSHCASGLIVTVPDPAPPAPPAPPAVPKPAAARSVEGGGVMRHTGRPRKDPGGVWAMREAAWNTMHRDARRKAILAQLRDVLPEREEGLHGWPEIVAFLTRLGLRNRIGGMVTPRVARGWRRRLGMPLLPGRPGQHGHYGVSVPFTTSYALVAWLLSLRRSGGPEMPVVGQFDSARQ